MKTKSYLIGLLCVVALAGLFAITKAPAQGNPHERRGAESVIINIGHNSNPANQHNIPVGVYVSASTSSAGAPKFPMFPEYYSASQAISDCLNLGYEIVYISNTMVTLVKPLGR